MTDLRRRMLEDMQLHGLSDGTREAYVRAVTNLAAYYGRSPDQLAEEHVRSFFVHLIKERRLARTTIGVYRYAIQFFYETTLKRPWPVFDLIQPKQRKRLPVVLSIEEVRQLLGLIRVPRIRMCLTMIYSCGLRRTEGTRLQVRDIDSGRMMIHVRNGKGGSDRYVPLPKRTLHLLRDYWCQDRPYPWLFPDSKANDEPIFQDKPYKAWKAALQESRIQKRDVAVHTLRHSYATHLLEAGVNLRVIQELLGHRSPKTTAIYTHLTPKILEGLQTTIDELMAPL